NPAITPLSSSQQLRFGLLQYSPDLVPDGLEPRVVHVVAKGIDEDQLLIAYMYPSKQLPF
ncbi:hypothetical protein H9Q73_014486, partial [Fusarium xylarioides]